MSRRVRARPTSNTPNTTTAAPSRDVRVTGAPVAGSVAPEPPLRSSDADSLCVVDGLGVGDAVGTSVGAGVNDGVVADGVGCGDVGVGEGMGAEFAAITEARYSGATSVQ